MKVLTPNLYRKMSNFAQSGKQGFEKLKTIGCKFERRSIPQIGVAIRLGKLNEKKGEAYFNFQRPSMSWSVTYPCDFSTCSLISLGNVASSIRRLYSFWATPDIPGTRFCCKYLLARSATADIHYRMYSLRSRTIFEEDWCNQGGSLDRIWGIKSHPPPFRINERISFLCFYTVFPHSLQSRPLAAYLATRKTWWCSCFSG